RQESTGRQVAIKILAHHLQNNARWKERFLDEARRLAELSHPNVVPVFDWGTHDGTGYIVMEYIRGGTLSQHLKSQPVTFRDAIQITQQIAAGLDFAGEKGYVHRDIKPDNILFREDGSLCILDFGIAKESDSNTTITSQGIPFGTGAYMSPEQAQPAGKIIDGRSDLYSLGIVLYEILTGTRPFDFRQYDAMKGFQMYLFAHVHSPPPPLPTAVETFQSVIDRLLAKNPNDRFSRGNDLREELARMASTLPEQELARTVRAPGESTLLMSGPPHPDATPVADLADEYAAAGHIHKTGVSELPADRAARERPSQTGGAVRVPVVPSRRKGRAWMAAGTVVVVGVTAGYFMLPGYIAAPPSVAKSDRQDVVDAIADTAPSAAAPNTVKDAITPPESDRLARVIAQQWQAARELTGTDPGNVGAQRQLLTRLQQIRQLAPSDAEANTQIAQLLERQVTHTRGLLERRELDRVPDHLTLIAELSAPAAADLQSAYAATQQTMTEQRQQQARLAELEQVIQRNLAEAGKASPDQAQEILLAAAESTRAAMKTNLAEENAARYRRQIAEGFSERIQQLIARDQFTSARQWLQQAEDAFVSTTAVASLERALQERRQRVAQRQQPARTTSAATATTAITKIEKEKNEKAVLAAPVARDPAPSVNRPSVTQPLTSPAVSTTAIPTVAQPPVAPTTPAAALAEADLASTPATAEIPAATPSTPAPAADVAPTNTEDKEETSPAKPRVRTFGSF
ncbi:MAG TPA: protein kinase, partial [Dongiaceae bacterium]|nr:protein kinase [Dongiaceae bacterium]